MDAATTGSTDTDAETYFTDATSHYGALQEQKAEIERRQQVLQELDQLVATIDQSEDHATLSVTRGEAGIPEDEPHDTTYITVGITASGMTETIRQVTEEYEWSVRFNLTHETEDSDLRWAPKTELGDLLDAETGA